MHSGRQLLQKTIHSVNDSKTQTGEQHTTDENPHQQRAQTVSALPAKAQRALINKLFGMFETVWPLQFKKAWPLDVPTLANNGVNLDYKLRSAKLQWLNNERFQQLTPTQVEQGIQHVESESRFIPSLADFIRYCTTVDYEQHGLPTVELAWQEVTHHCHEQTTHAWSHEAVYAAAKATDFFSIRCAQGDEVKALRKTFESLYRQLCNRIARGEQIPDVRPALEDARRQSLLDINEQYHEAKLQAQIKAQGLQQLTSAKSALAAMRSRLANGANSA
ncbi:replication protein P [Zooshikella harenae]|uniref:Uncharacterized protein n=1 Tax=Zooshikella harenae TaxID=2827238 RepID=A0ABS5ZID8_9GAMM|nr:replication protein P [Zooshikella harenae]MBU2713623.1 hypothetical protein [Zooshikella harenae]